MSLGKSRIVKFPFIKDDVIQYKFSDNDKKIIKTALEKLIKFVKSCGAINIYIVDNHNAEVIKYLLPYHLNKFYLKDLKGSLLLDGFHFQSHKLI